jgi:electron transport complex protein RnfD
MRVSAVNNIDPMKTHEGEEEISLDDLVISSSPHITSQESIPKIMYSVVISLLPASIGAVYFFGLRALVLIIVTIGVALATEAIFQMARKKEITIWDGSALVTGLLLALNLPSALPFWMAAVGAIVAITIGKQVFGGLGQNPFNPALIGRVFLFITFPRQMTTWVIDGKTMATPLGAMKFEGQMTPYSDLFWGKIGGSLGETSVLLLLIGAAYLIYKGYIDWRIPLGLLGTVALLTIILGHDPLFHLMSGGLVLAAFFMATDMVTTPVTQLGKWLFSIGAGIIVVVIRLYGGYAEGISFAILLMNAITPLLDRYTRPRVFGT